KTAYELLTLFALSHQHFLSVTMVAFGGAGPVHAARLARKLGMTRILVPLTPGILCALGLLMTDLRTSFASTSLQVMDAGGIGNLQSIFDELEGRARHWFDEEGIAPQRQGLRRTIDLRYVGQHYEIAVNVPDGPISAATLKAVEQGFLDSHRQLYGFIAEGEPIQMVTYRVEAIGTVDKAQLTRHEMGGEDA